MGYSSSNDDVCEGKERKGGGKKCGEWTERSAAVRERKGQGRPPELILSEKETHYE